MIICTSCLYPFRLSGFRAVWNSRPVRNEASRRPSSLSLFFGNARDSVRAICTFVTGTYHNVISRHTGSKNSAGHNARLSTVCDLSQYARYLISVYANRVASLKHRRYGISRTLVSDGNRQFLSRVYKETTDGGRHFSRSCEAEARRV